MSVFEESLRCRHLHAIQEGSHESCSVAPLSITRNRYPVHPGGDTLKLYARLFDEAQYLSRSRGAYRGIVERQRAQIADLQGELQQFSQQMELTLQQKAELKRILNGYAGVMGELEAAGSKLEEHFEQNGAWGVFSFSALQDAVRAFVQTFRISMQQAKEIKELKALEASNNVNC